MDNESKVDKNFQVMSEIGSLNGRVGELIAEEQQLIARLSTVLREEVGDNKEVAIPADKLVEVAENIREIRWRVECRIKIIKSVVSRLEI